LFLNLDLDSSSTGGLNFLGRLEETGREDDYATTALKVSVKRVIDLGVELRMVLYSFSASMALGVQRSA